MLAVNTETQNSSFIGGLASRERVLENPLSAEAAIEIKGAEFPNSKSELWKYSRTGKIKNGNFSFQAPTEQSFTHLSNQEINIINGVICDFHVAGPKVFTLNQLSDQQLQQFGTVSNFHRDIFGITHQAYHQDAVFIEVPANTKLEEPVQINIAATGENSLSLPRVFIYADENSKASFIINMEHGNAKQFQHLVTECMLEHHAHLSIDVIQNCKTEFNLCDIASNLNTGAQFFINTLQFEGDWFRNNLDISIIGEHAHTSLNGIVMPSEKQHFDNHTMVNHCVANCTSSENYKNIISDKGTAIFNGKIMVHQDAQKTNAFQSSSNVLLSDDATVNAKPELEIYADDVKCSHGSTTGKLNEEALFYLRSRGIPERAAKKLLLKAFSGEVLDEIRNESVRNFAEEKIDLKLQ